MAIDNACFLLFDVPDNHQAVLPTGTSFWPQGRAEYDIATILADKRRRQRRVPASHAPTARGVNPWLSPLGSANGAGDQAQPEGFDDVFDSGNPQATIGPMLLMLDPAGDPDFNLLVAETAQDEATSEGDSPGLLGGDVLNFPESEDEMSPSLPAMTPDSDSDLTSAGSEDLYLSGLQTPPASPPNPSGLVQLQADAQQDDFWPPLDTEPSPWSTPPQTTPISMSGVQPWPLGDIQITPIIPLLETLTTVPPPMGLPPPAAYPTTPTTTPPAWDESSSEIGPPETPQTAQAMKPVGLIVVGARPSRWRARRALKEVMRATWRIEKTSSGGGGRQRNRVWKGGRRVRHLQEQQRQARRRCRDGCCPRGGKTKPGGLGWLEDRRGWEEV